MLVVAAGVVLFGTAGMAAARSVYYSPSGDVYMSVTRMHGVRFILLRTFSLRGPGEGLHSPWPVHGLP